VSLAPTATPPTPPTPVPTATPFLGLGEGEIVEEPRSGGNLLLWLIAGLGLLAVVVALILAVRGRDRGERREA
jgi:hypothetical protein